MRRYLGTGSRSSLSVGGAAPARMRRPATGSRPIVDTAIGSALLIGVSVTVVLAFRLVNTVTIGWAGLAVLAVAKLAAVAALGTGGGWRGSSSRAERSSMFEAATMGSLLAFVASLALGRAAPLPGVLLLVDWVATLAALTWTRHATTHAPRPIVDSEPEIIATFRDRVVMAVWPAGKVFLAVETHLRSLGPKRLVIARDGEAADRFGELRPDVVLVADDGGRSSTIAVRRLANAALRERVSCVVLLTTGIDSGGPTFAERIVRALSGLTKTRMVRVRAGLGAIDADASRRIARIAAKGQDGSGYPRGGGDWESDAASLWRELDAM